MNKKLFLRISAGLILFTCLGHTIGTFTPVPQEEPELVKAVETMKTAFVPMPMGKKQNYFDILLGANLCLSIYLLVTGIGFIMFSSSEPSHASIRSQLFLQSLGLILVAIVSGLFFFPLPAFCTGVAGVLGMIVLSQK